MKKQTVILIIVGVVILAGIGFAFRKIQQKAGEMVAEKVISGATGAKVDLQNDGKGMTIRGKNGEQVTIGGTTIPEDFPKDMPIYPGSKPQGSWSGSSKKSNGFYIVVETTDSSDKVTSYYKQELVSQGWSIENTVAADELTMLSVKKDSRTGAVSITSNKEDGKTMISLTVGSNESEQDEL